MRDEAEQQASRTTDPAAVEPGEPDDALILWMLSLTPTQRLEALQGFIDSGKSLQQQMKSIKPD
jgi:hypothetical protein